MSDPVGFAKLRASIEAAVKAKNFEQVAKYRTFLHNHAQATPTAEITAYVTLVDKKYVLLLKKDVENHLKLVQRSMQTVAKLLQTGTGLDEFEDELFNEEKLNKVALEYYNEEEADDTIAENDDEESEEDQEATSSQTVSPRRALREWKKCETAATQLGHPKYYESDEARAFIEQFNAMRPAALARMELEDVRRIIKTRRAASRYARIRAALIRNDATIVLRHYAAIRDDAAQLRAQHPDHAATQIFALRADALVHMVEQRRTALEAQCEAEKERRLSGIKEVMKEVREAKDGETKVWQDTKGEADAAIKKHRELTGQELDPTKNK